MTRRSAIISGLFPALVLALGVVSGPAHAGQNAKKLDPLFRELAQATSPATAADIEKQIWGIWLDSGSKAVNVVLDSGISAMENGELNDAIQDFIAVTRMDPDFAEGWNKLATAYYLDGDFDKSMADIKKTLTLEPRHFGAISGMGLIFLQQGDDRDALTAFEKVLKIYPLAPQANTQVKRLKKKLAGQGV